MGHKCDMGWTWGGDGVDMGTWGGHLVDMGWTWGGHVCDISDTAKRCCRSCWQHAVHIPITTLQKNKLRGGQPTCIHDPILGRPKKQRSFCFVCQPG